MAPESLDALDLRQLRLGEGTVGADHELRLHVVAPIRANVPYLLALVPSGGGDCGLEDGDARIGCTSWR